VNEGLCCVLTQDTLESLCELYSLLKEDDMFTAVWLKRARLPEVSLALTYEQHGFFEQAQLAYEQVNQSRLSAVKCALLKPLMPTVAIWVQL